MTQKGPPSSSLGNDKEGGSGAQQEKEQVKTPVGAGMSARDLRSRRPYPEHPQMSGECKCQVFLDKDTFFRGLGTPTGYGRVVAIVEERQAHQDERQLEENQQK